MRRLEYETRTGLSRAKEQTEGRGVGAVSATPPQNRPPRSASSTVTGCVQ